MLPPVRGGASNVAHCTTVSPLVPWLRTPLVDLRVDVADGVTTCAAGTFGMLVEATTDSGTPTIMRRV